MNKNNSDSRPLMFNHKQLSLVFNSSVPADCLVFFSLTNNLNSFHSSLLCAFPFKGIFRSFVACFYSFLSNPSVAHFALFLFPAEQLGGIEMLYKESNMGQHNGSVD